MKPIAALGVYSRRKGEGMVMRIIIVILALLFGGMGSAQARCSDELQELKAQVERQNKRQPTVQTAAAAKEIDKTEKNLKQMDEVDCYNSVAHARRTLTTPPPPPAPDKKAQQ
jgi:hypothetical protein